MSCFSFNIRTIIGPSGKNEPLITLKVPDAPWAEQVPKNFNLKFTNTAPKNEFVFTEDSQGRAIEVAGKIEHEATLGPVIDEDYRKIMQSRTANVSASNSSRVVKPMDDKSTKNRRILSSATNSYDPGFGLHVSLVVYLLI
jgi:transcription initiation factor TFIIF subunit beta